MRCQPEGDESPARPGPERQQFELTANKNDLGATKIFFLSIAWSRAVAELWQTRNFVADVGIERQNMLFFIFVFESICIFLWCFSYNLIDTGGSGVKGFTAEAHVLNMNKNKNNGQWKREKWQGHRRWS
jgi:hypothetical protein